jgi:hypothetical protein
MVEMFSVMIHFISMFNFIKWILKIIVSLLSRRHDEVSDKMICVLRQSSSHVHQFIETSFTKKKKIKD